MTFKIYSGPASPYSQKIRSVFRYRRIPHTWLFPMGWFIDGPGRGFKPSNQQSFYNPEGLTFTSRQSRQNYAVMRSPGTII